MDPVLPRLKLLDSGTEMIPIGKAFVELRDMLAQDTDFLLRDLVGLFGDLTSLLSSTEFVGEGTNGCAELTHALACCNSFRFQVCQLFRLCSHLRFKRLHSLVTGGELSLG